MTQDFATAMRRALDATRSGDPGAATAIIQSALGNDAGGLAIDLPGTNPSPAPDDARVQRRRHTGATGARDYRLFVPTPRDGGYRGVVIMLHGCTQNPDDFARGTRMDACAETEGYIVAYPGQTARHNAQSCWNWFQPAHQSQGEAAMLAALARDLDAEFGTKGRIFAAGLSAGGAMAAILGDAHSDTFRAVGVHSGLPAGAAGDVNEAFAAMRNGSAAGRAARIPSIVFHGTFDTTVSCKNADTMISGDGIETPGKGNGRSWRRTTTADGSELWKVTGAGHAWFGGDARGSYTDAQGPDASSEMLRFFNEKGAIQ